jgi:hypothetical protein
VLLLTNNAPAIVAVALMLNVACELEIELVEVGVPNVA